MIAAMPVIIAFFLAVHRHYGSIGRALRLDLRPPARRDQHVRASRARSRARDRESRRVRAGAPPRTRRPRLRRRSRGVRERRRPMARVRAAARVRSSSFAADEGRPIRGAPCQAPVAPGGLRWVRHGRRRGGAHEPIAPPASGPPMGLLAEALPLLRGRHRGGRRDVAPRGASTCREPGAWSRTGTWCWSPSPRVHAAAARAVSYAMSLEASEVRALFFSTDRGEKRSSRAPGSIGGWASRCRSSTRRSGTSPSRCSRRCAGTRPGRERS